jgi:hypothetical protein
MKTSTILIASLAMAATVGSVQAGGISSISFSYGQTVNHSQPYPDGSQQSLSFGISVGGGCAQPVYQPVVVGYPQVVYAPRPVVVMPAPVCPVAVYAPRPVVVAPYGAAAMAAHNIGMAHAAAAHNIGMAHAAAWARHHR